MGGGIFLLQNDNALVGMREEAYDSEALLLGRLATPTTLGACQTRSRGDDLLQRQMTSALTYVDGAIGSMVEALRDRKLLSSTELIISAKHGQSPIDPSVAATLMVVGSLALLFSGVNRSSAPVFAGPRTMSYAGCLSDQAVYSPADSAQVVLVPHEQEAEVA